MSLHQVHAVRHAPFAMQHGSRPMTFGDGDEAPEGRHVGCCEVEGHGHNAVAVGTRAPWVERASLREVGWESAAQRFQQVRLRGGGQEERRRNPWLPMSMSGNATAQVCDPFEEVHSAQGDEHLDILRRSHRLAGCCLDRG